MCDQWDGTARKGRRFTAGVPIADGDQWGMGLPGPSGAPGRKAGVPRWAGATQPASRGGLDGWGPQGVAQQWAGATQGDPVIRGCPV